MMVDINTCYLKVYLVRSTLVNIRTQGFLINWSAVRMRDGPPAKSGSYSTGCDSLILSGVPQGYPLEKISRLDPPASVVDQPKKIPAKGNPLPGISLATVKRVGGVRRGGI